MDERAEPVERIVEELQAGFSVEANFRRLFEIYHHRLVHFFARRGFSHPDCLDLTQETFLGIYRGIGSFRAEARFESWLFTVATNAWRKRLRSGTTEKRAGREVPLDDPGDAGEAERAPRELPAGGPGPREEALAKERSTVLRAAVERLPEQMRRCLTLRIDQDLKYREIGALLHLSPETVKIHLARARQRLREELGDYLGDAVQEAEETGEAAS
jgi:RNA polymerase sigma-70 factor, ECF subfamily